MALPQPFLLLLSGFPPGFLQPFLFVAPVTTRDGIIQSNLGVFPCLGEAGVMPHCIYGVSPKAFPHPSCCQASGFQASLQQLCGFYITFYLPAIGGFYFKSPSEGLSPMSPHSEPLPELALTSRTAAAGVLLCSTGQMPRDKALLLLCTLFLRALLSLRIPQFGQSARCFQVQVVTLAADGTTSGTDMREEKQNSD